MSAITVKGRRRSLEKRLSYALSNPLRVEILSALNDSPRTTAELAKLIHQSLSATGNHLKALLDDGAIEVAETRMARAVPQNVYRAVRLPLLTEEEMAELPFESRQEIYSLILQNSTAEAMAALAAGKISDDPKAHMMWSWHHVDARGHDEIADVLVEARERIIEIEAEAAARCAAADESTKTIMVITHAFERSRKPLRTPQRPD
jgi:DNA-binding transcriptional ArsR family regulator